jgi:hypothetical protein
VASHPKPLLLDALVLLPATELFAPVQDDMDFGRLGSAWFGGAGLDPVKLCDCTERLAVGGEVVIRRCVGKSRLSDRNSTRGCPSATLYRVETSTSSSRPIDRKSPYSAASRAYVSTMVAQLVAAQEIH